VIQEHERKQTEFERRTGSESLDDLPGVQGFFVRAGPHEIEVQLIGVHFGEEVGATGEVFQVEEFVFQSRRA